MSPEHDHLLKLLVSRWEQGIGAGPPSFKSVKNFRALDVPTTSDADTSVRLVSLPLLAYLTLADRLLYRAEHFEVPPLDIKADAAGTGDKKVRKAKSKIDF